LPHEPQLVELVVVLTHDPLQSVGVEAGQPETHPVLEHAGVPLSAAQTWPQAVQLLGSVVRLTQALPHLVKPLLHVKEQPLSTHEGLPLATEGQEWPQLPQLFASLVVVVHVPAHSVGVPEEHPETHEYELPDPEHTGVPLSALHGTPQAPQLVAVVY
jgi:hypothetical protein